MSLRALPSAARFLRAHHIMRAAFTRSVRKYATNWVRFSKNVILERARNYIVSFFCNNLSQEQTPRHSDNDVVAQLRQFCMNARKRSLRKIGFVRCSCPLFADTSAYGRGEAAALCNMCALKNAAARGKPLGFPLKIARFCFIIAIGDCGALVFAIASK